MQAPLPSTVLPRARHCVFFQDSPAVSLPVTLLPVSPVPSTPFTVSFTCSDHCDAISLL